MTDCRCGFKQWRCVLYWNVPWTGQAGY